MRRHEALPSKYLAKEDFDQPVLARIGIVQSEEIEGDHGRSMKPVLYITDPSSPVDVGRGIILNGTNWDVIEQITGEPDSADWHKAQIVIYHDTEVTFGRKKVGGIRMRAPKQAAAPEPDPESESPAAHDDPIDSHENTVADDAL